MRVMISGAFEASPWQNPLFPGVALAVEELGHEVYRLDASFFDRPKPWQKLLERMVTVPVRLAGLPKRVVKPYLPWTATSQQERALLAAVQAFKPDMLLVMSYVRYRPSVLKLCREMGVGEIVGWFLEGPNHEYDAQDECLLYDRYFCIHERIDSTMASRIQHLPAICLDSVNFHPDPSIPTRHRKIVFVGGLSPRRVTYLRELKGLPLEIWGPGGWAEDPDLADAFKGEFIWGAALNQLYNEASIVVNISSWEPHLSGLTQRVIDVPASGAFLLTDACEEIQKIYVPGRDIDTFTDPQDLRGKCLQYLDNHAQRERMASCGFERATAFASSIDIARRLVAQ